MHRNRRCDRFRVAASDRRAARRQAQTRPPSVGLRVVFGLMGAFLACYLASLIVQSPDHAWPVFEDWVIASFEVAGSFLCLAKGVTSRPGRAMALTLGLGLLMWALGDVVTTIESQGGVTPPTPSLADLFFLGFFPFTYVAVVICLRGESRRLSTPSWLDGAVAGLGAAALCAAFAFPSVLRLAGGGPREAVTNLVYPIADLLLLGLIVGGTTVVSGARKWPWVLLASGNAINLVGDTANLFNSSLGRTGFVLDAIAWPASIWVLAMSVWVRPRPMNPLTSQKPGTFVIPGFSAAGALVILSVGTVHRVSRIGEVLAIATLLIVGVRLVSSVRAMRALSQQRQHQAVTDELTGLGNRRRLATVLDAFFAENATAIRSRYLAFLFVDLDHFKEVNDTFGHPAGDEVLRQLGPRLSACLRESDLLIRLGGDEFVVLLIDADTDAATGIAQRLTDSLASPFVVGTTSVRIGASIGIAIAPTDATDSAGLLWCADIAMYRAKLGGVPFENYQPEVDKFGNRVELLDGLRTAIQEHQLVLYYQPQLDLRSGKIVGVEALIRWAHPTLGAIAPLEFLPFAEEAGLTGAITELVCTDAITQCAIWRREGNYGTVSVNISATDLLDPLFSTMVSDLLAQHDVPGDALVVELTETSVISDFDRSQRVIQELCDLGIAVSIDDFGAGFTSLAHLNRLAVSELKLDRTFIIGLTAADNRRGIDLVRATIDLGHALGLRVVAEGIEEPAALQLLSDLGCDLGQGYLIGIPKPANHPGLSAGVLASAAPHPS